MTHAPGCHHPGVALERHYSVTTTRCIGCGAVVAVHRTTATGSSYHCPTHPTETVTWRGTGCRVCEAPALSSPTTGEDTT